MSAPRADTGRFEPRTALFIGLLVAGVHHLSSTVISGLHFMLLDPASFDDSDGEAFSLDDTSVLEWVGLTEPWSIILGVLLLVAGLVGFVSLRRNDHMARLSIWTLTAGVALAPLISYGVSEAIARLIHR